MRTHRAAILFGTCLLAFAVVNSAAAVDQPVVIVSPEAVVPQRLEVHVGEMVRWRAVGGGRLQIELDRHPSAHEIVVREGEVRGFFRKAGEHSYIATIVRNGRRALRGIVVVREALQPTEQLVCDGELFDRICFAP